MTVDLNRNLRIYGWVRMLSARVYLPLITIYVSEVGHLNLAQIGTLTAIAAAVSLISNIPTGYFADRRTRRAAMITGSLSIIISTLVYVLFPSYPGAIMATIFDALGYSFISGAGEALVHDTLVRLNRVGEYVKVMGKAHSFGMTGNVVLVGLVPLTYAMDKRLPFLCGTVAVIVFLLMVNAMIEPPRPVDTGEDTSGNHARRLGRALRQFVNRRTLLLFVAIGLMNASYTAYVPFSQLTLKDIGLDPSLMGIMFATASVISALGGWFIHYLNRLSLLQYALLDTAIGSGYVLVLGFTRSLPLAILAFLINMSFWRLRSIIYQDNLLRRFGNHHNKATLISTISFFAGLQQLWLPLAFATIVAAHGYYTGLILIGLGILGVASTVFIAAVTIWQPDRRTAQA